MGKDKLPLSKTTIELREIYEAWGYSNTVLVESEDLQEIIPVLLVHCREYYGCIGMDCPRIELTMNNNNTLKLDCGIDFHNLNTDEKVVDYITKWYNKTKEV